MNAAGRSAQRFRRQMTLIGPSFARFLTSPPWNMDCQGLNGKSIMKLSLRLVLLGLLAALALSSDDPAEVGTAEEASKGKPLDLLVWGATGFTGRWVVEYLIKQYGVQPADFKWGIGGRSLAKLNEMKKELTSLDPAATGIPTVIGDGTDPKSIRDVVRQTRVVVTTAGPYAQYGTELVRACVAEGVHYADLTGEILWMREMIDQFHDQAAKNRVKIVHTCGFDSIPSDMGTFMVVSYIKEKFGKKTRSVKVIETDSYGGVSGGTIASLFGQVNQALAGGPEEWRRFHKDMYLLNPSDNIPDWDKTNGGVGYDKTTKIIHGPFAMAGINARVVRRSNALQGNAYGAPFHYKEVGGAKGIKGLAKTTINVMIDSAMSKLFAFGPTRRLLERVLPKPGTNPSRELCESGYFWEYVVAEAATEPGEEPITVVGRVGTNAGDMGYKETAHMLLEAGLVMALDQDTAPKLYGVLTPASAFGDALLSRLRETGMTFEVLPPGSPLPKHIRPPKVDKSKEEL